jgi:hypothetical protein
MNSPWMADVVMGTMLVSILGYVAITRTIAAWSRGWIAFQLFSGDVRKATLSLHSMILLLQRIEQELIFMRNMTQAAVQNSDSQVAQPQPPLGRAGQMPPPFPTPQWPQTPVPDATLDDTDRGLLEQSEADLRDAQIREELTARGIDVQQYDAGELPAVVEEA